MAVVAALLVLTLRELGWLPVGLPELKLRVPPRVVSGPGWSAALVWGGVLGLGFLTFVRFGVFWAVHAVVFALGSPILGTATGATYGVSRATPALLIWLHPQWRRRWFEPTAVRIFAQAHLMDRVGIAIMVVSAIAIVTVSWLDRAVP